MVGLHKRYVRLTSSRVKVFLLKRLLSNVADFVGLDEATVAHIAEGTEVEGKVPQSGMRRQLQPCLLTQCRQHSCLRRLHQSPQIWQRRRSLNAIWEPLEVFVLSSEKMMVMISHVHA